MYITTKKQRGFTLVETLLYTAGLLVLLGAIVSFLFYLNDWYRNATLEPRADRAGIELIDKIIKDVRAGEIVAGDSVLGSDNGTLSLSGYTNGLPITRYFTLNNGRIEYQENGGATDEISPADMTVSRFRLVQLTTPLSSGIHVDIDISFKAKTGTTTKTYSGFSMLRHSYE